MSKRLKADLFILGVMIFWSFSFILTDFATTILGTFTLNAWRFLTAFTVSTIFSFKYLKNISKPTLLYSFLLGLLLACMFTSMTYGIQYSILSNASFLCGLPVIFTPLLSSIIYRKIPETKLVIIVLICVSGIACLTLTDQFTINYDTLKGDILCILCSLIYSVYLLMTEKAVMRTNVNPFQLGILQLGVCGLFSLMAAFLVEKPILPDNLKLWSAILFLAIICTAVAFIVQTVAQQYTTASHVSIINCFETVFAGIIAYTIGKEILTFQAAIGALLIVMALFAMEINISAVYSNLRKRLKENS